MAIGQISLKSKLVFMLLGIALGCILVVGYQGLHNGKKALTDRVYNQLTSISESKSAQLKTWFTEKQGQVQSLAVDHTIIRAMREFNSAFQRLRDSNLSEKELSSLQSYYENQYLPALAKNIDGTPPLEHYFPHEPATQYLQYQYISANHQPDGEKLQLNKANDHSYYTGVHQNYQPFFRQIMGNYGFGDMYLIDIESGNIIYSVNKHVDFASSLKSGVFKSSNFGRLYTRVKHSQDLGAVQVVDFDFYRPTLGKPAAFFGTTIYDEDKKPIGMLAVQTSVDALDNVMTGNQGWERQGLGKTGEAFLVGDDFLMRSNARLLFGGNQQDCYALKLGSGIISKATAQKICQLKTSILLQKVENQAVSDALNGESGTRVVTGYSGEDALVSYTPLQFGDRKWAVVSQLDLSEANEPINQFTKELSISAVIIASIVTFLAMSLAYFFTKPISELMKGVNKLSQGETDLHIELHRDDEYGQLATVLNDTGQLIEQQKHEIEEKKEENRKLLLNMFPEKVARQVEYGESDIAERKSNVSVLYTTLRGFSEYAEKLDPQKAIQMLNNLITDFDKAAEAHEIEKVKTVGDSYLAASGLNISRLDHANRCVAFGSRLLDIVDQFNRQHGTYLAIRIGIHSGSVLAGIIGRSKFVYDLWGDAVNVASRIRFETPLNSLIITDDVYQRLGEKSAFSIKREISTQGMGKITVWIYDPGYETQQPEPETDEFVVTDQEILAKQA